MEASELSDADGLEKEYQRSYVGMANISLDNISISKDLDVKVNQFRVYRIMSSIKNKYDPSMSVAVVCPEEGQSVKDLKNVQGQKFVVIQKVHTICAFKELDKTDNFAKLPSHENRTVLCFVLRTNSAGLIHYGNLRASEIENQFGKKTRPQDLLRIYQSLCERSSPSDSMKSVERMSRLCRIGPNESAALRKICNWSPDAFSALMKVLSQFERYETMDVKQDGQGYQNALALGEKMALTNVLFKMLAKVNDEDFLAEHEKILNSECSLKAFIEEDNTHKQVEKVSSVLSILADYKPIESIRQEQPGKF